MIFANIEYLFLLLLLIPYIIWYIMKRKKTEPTMQVSTTRMYMNAPKSWKLYLLHAPFLLRIVAFVMIVLVLARPQTTDNWQNTEIEGIDIMLAVDVSTSMLAEDLKPNRLEAAKQVAAEFINGRPNDNIGLTIFAGEAFTQCPLTVDHGVLLNLFQSIKCDIAQKGLIMDGTALGMGLANAVSRLKDSKAKSKVIILQQPWRYFSVDSCRNSQTVWYPCIHNWGWNQWNGTISDADLCRSAICTGPGGD
jgi:Ca-activated chloride channel family protein